MKDIVETARQALYEEPEASVAYNKQAAQIKKRMSNIDKLMSKMNKDQKKDPKNWGFVGNATSINNQLEEVEESLSGR